MVSDNIRGWMDFIDETELVIMANADLTFDHPKPLFPNVISVEGLTVKEGKPLSKGRSNSYLCEIRRTAAWIIIGCARVYLFVKVHIYFCRK